ncbi:hypothetical protein BURKHO8Y_180032 [Burkholderia sp. 8Y]|nr:hypothetical protein BURKHO8Y_180032 [Burkholderia sp. 8Y]
MIYLEMSFYRIEQICRINSKCVLGV